MFENTHQSLLGYCFIAMLGCIFFGLSGCEKDDGNLIEGGEPLPPGSNIGRTTTGSDTQGGVQAQSVAGSDGDCACTDGQTAVEGQCYNNADVTIEDGEKTTVKDGAESFECQAPAGGDTVPVGGDDAPIGGDNTGAPIGGDDTGAPIGGDDTGEPMGGMSVDPNEGVGEACGNDDAGYGFCADNTGTMCEGEFKAGLCPGAANVQCCISHTCTTAGGDEGFCIGEATCDEYSGTATPGLCPANASVTCCTGLDEDTMEMTSGNAGGSEVPQTDEPMGGESGDTGEPVGGMSIDGSEGIGFPCGNDNSGYGFCADNTDTICEGDFVAGLCPGDGPVQCCMSHTCTTNDGAEGLCIGEATCTEYGGIAIPGLCPGNASVGCCTGL